MKKNLIILCSIILFTLSGCSNNSNNDYSELKKLIEDNTKQIEKLSTKNAELEKKIETLESEKTKLSEEIVALQNKDKTIDSSIDSKYSELKTLINK